MQIKESNLRNMTHFSKHSENNKYKLIEFGIEIAISY